MKIREWSEARRRSNPQYDDAARQVSFAQDVADWIVDHRVRAGLTQTQLADLAGTSQAAISRIETGDGNPTLDTVSRVMSTLMSHLSPRRGPEGQARKRRKKVAG